MGFESDIPHQYEILKRLKYCMQYKTKICNITSTSPSVFHKGLNAQKLQLHQFTLKTGSKSCVDKFFSKSQWATLFGRLKIGQLFNAN